MVILQIPAISRLQTTLLLQSDLSAVAKLLHLIALHKDFTQLTPVKARPFCTACDHTLYKKFKELRSYYEGKGFYKQDQEISEVTSSEFVEACEVYRLCSNKKRGFRAYERAKKEKNVTDAEILEAVKQYIGYLKVATWRKKKDLIPWLNNHMFLIDWSEQIDLENIKNNKNNIQFQTNLPTDDITINDF